MKVKREDFQLTEMVEYLKINVSNLYMNDDDDYN